MNLALKELTSIPFSGSDIISALDGEVKIMKYRDIKNYNNIDEVLLPYNKVVLLYEIKPKYGHWCCLFKNNNTIEFFDPYGMKIDKQLDFINDNFKKESNQDYPYLSRLLLKSPYKLTYNDKKLQEKKEDVSSCGRHCCIRLILGHIPIKKYQELMESKGGDNPDNKVTYLTAFI
jgi:hypothetical protein